MGKLKTLFILMSAIFSTYCMADETKTFTTSRYFCEVEVRAGNHFDPLDNPVIFPVREVSAGWSISTTQTFLFAQREANPGVCGSGRGAWIRCSWDTCELN